MSSLYPFLLFYIFVLTCKIKEVKPATPAFILKKYEDFAARGDEFKVRHGYLPSLIRFCPSIGRFYTRYTRAGFLLGSS